MLRILVVDDEAPIREWIIYCIEKAGKSFNIVGTAKSGKEAYELVLEHKPHVVITDIKMPGMDGIELMQLVKKVLPYTVFIILTNHAEFSYAKKAITYGAKEYLLKSELRSIDLMNILEDVLQEQTNLIEGKNAEILSNGYIDLYSLYQNYEDENYGLLFWGNLGMDKNKPYGVIGVSGDITFNQRQLIIQISTQVSPYYFNIALRHQIIYIIIQEENKQVLEEQINKFATLYFEATGQNTIIGQFQEGLQYFIKVLEHTQATLLSTFFEKEKGIFSYNHLSKMPILDRNLIRGEYRDILSLLSLKQYEKAGATIKVWFNHFSQINVQDVVWSKEMCMQMVNSIEEKFYQINSEYEDSNIATRQINSVYVCKEMCLDIINKMDAVTGGVRSKSINKALNFIHQNYNGDISLIKVANHIYLSPEYFSRLFKEEVGVNFSVYLTMYRLNYAEQLLQTSDLQISQIAYQAGYTNPGYFSRIYKKYMSMTPEEARSQDNVKRSK